MIGRSLAILLLLAGCRFNQPPPPPGPSSGGAAAIICTSEQSVNTAFSGNIGVNYSANVQAKLKNGRGNTLSPFSSRTSTSSNGIAFISTAYSDLEVGVYTVEVTASGARVETYSLSVSSQGSPIITILCG